MENEENNKIILEKASELFASLFYAVLVDKKIINQNNNIETNEENKQEGDRGICG
jgi:hypothetical protein